MKLFSNKTRQFAAKFSLFTLVFGITYEFFNPKKAEAVDVSGLGSAIIGCSHIGEALVDMVSELGKKNLADEISDMQKKVWQAASAGDIASARSAVKTFDATVAEEAAKQKQIAQQQQDKINCKDAMGRAAANIALTNITQQTVNWANTGLSGNPLYVVDSKSYFAGVKEKALNSFINDLSSANNAFAQQITKELIQNQQAKNDRKLRELRTDQKQKTGFTSAEFEEDFNNGGWSGFLNYNLNSANNPLGSRFAVQQELSAQQAEEVNAQKDELIWNNGFLSIKKCADPHNKGDNCKAFETQTPGIIIQNQLAKALGVPVDKLTNVQYYNDALGGLLDGLMNSLFNQGLAQIFKGQQQGLTNNNFLQGDNYGGSNISTLGSSSFNADNLFTYTTSWFGINSDFDIRNMKQFDAVIQTQEDYIDAMYNTTNGSYQMLDKIITPIAELDVCVPGPNPVWQQETAENINIFLDSVATSYQNGGTTPIVTGKELKGLSVTGGVLITVGAALQVIPVVGTVVGAVVAAVGVILKVIQVIASGDSAKKAAAINAQNTANLQAVTAESESNQRRLAWGMSLTYADYSARVAKAYDKNHLLPIADVANPIVANLRNYDNNITDLKDLYYERKQETLLNISRLNQLQSSIRPIVNAARQRALLWNRLNCPIEATTDSGLDGVDSGPGNGTDSGGGDVDSGPGNGTGAGTGGGTDGGGGGTGAGSGGGTGTGVGTGGTGAGTGTGGQ